MTRQFCVPAYINKHGCQHVVRLKNDKRTSVRLDRFGIAGARDSRKR